MAITVFSALFGMMLPTDSYCFWGLETTIRLIFAHIPWKWRHVSFLLVTHIPHHSREPPPLRSSLTPKNGRYHQLLRDFTKIWSRIWGSRYPPAIKHSNGNPSFSSTTIFRLLPSAMFDRTGIFKKSHIHNTMVYLPKITTNHHHLYILHINRAISPFRSTQNSLPWMIFPAIDLHWRGHVPLYSFGP